MRSTENRIYGICGFCDGTSRVRPFGRLGLVAVRAARSLARSLASSLAAGASAAGEGGGSTSGVVGASSVAVLSEELVSGTLDTSQQ